MVINVPGIGGPPGDDGGPYVMGPVAPWICTATYPFNVEVTEPGELVIGVGDSDIDVYMEPEPDAVELANEVECDGGDADGGTDGCDDGAPCCGGMRYDADG